MVDDGHPGYEELRRAYEKAREVSAHPGPYFDFRMALLESEAAAAEGEGFSISPSGRTPEEWADRFAAGRPLIDPAGLRIDPDVLRDRARAVGCVFEAHQLPFGGAIADRVMEEGGETVRTWVEALLGRRERDLARAARAFDVEGGTLAFFVTEVVRPLLRGPAAVLGEPADTERWRRGFCPVCGAGPVFSQYERKSSRRRLLCGACDTVWTAPRVTCPFCGNPEGSRLGFFYHEDAPRYRIDHCQKCRRYIKAVDLNAVPEGEAVWLRVEDARTLYLDLAAEKKGFRRG
jgi:FdhE protein